MPIAAPMGRQSSDSVIPGGRARVGVTRDVIFWIITELATVATDVVDDGVVNSLECLMSVITIIKEVLILMICT